MSDFTLLTCFPPRRTGKLRKNNPSKLGSSPQAFGLYVKEILCFSRQHLLDVTNVNKTKSSYQRLNAFARTAALVHMQAGPAFL